MKEFKVWKTNRFNDEILTDLVAVFYDFKKAKSFVEFQAFLAESYVITYNGNIIDID